jgi:hypothetical protein
MNHRSLLIAGGLAVVAVAGACTSSVGLGALRPFAFIDVRELPANNATGIGAFAAAVFVQDRVTGVVPSSALGESCQPAAPIVVSSGGGDASGSNLDPGSVSMTLKGPVDTTTRTVSLAPSSVSNGLLRWTNGTAPSFQAGSDSIRFDVAGSAGGFPAFSIRTASVPHFIAQPVDDSIVGQGIRIQWTALSATSPTRMQISLQYADATADSPNMEVRCVAFDDGDFTIPRQYLSEWQDAGDDESPRPHQAVLSRFLTIGANVADGIAAVVTRVDTTIVK